MENSKTVRNTTSEPDNPFSNIRDNSIDNSRNGSKAKAASLNLSPLNTSKKTPTEV